MRDFFQAGYSACLGKFGMASDGSDLRTPPDPELDMRDNGGVGRRRMSTVNEAAGLADTPATTPPLGDPVEAPRGTAWDADSIRPRPNPAAGHMSDVNQAFQMNADFGHDSSSMTQPGAVNPVLNPVVGPGPFSNKTDTTGGYTP